MTEALARARIRNTEMRQAAQECLRAESYAGWVTGYRPAYQRRAAAMYERVAERYRNIEMSLVARHFYLKAAEWYARGGRPAHAADCARQAEACPVFWDDSCEVSEP